MSSSIDSNTMDPENVISFIPANGGKEKRAKKLKQLIKIAIPHVALYLLLLGYLLAGAWVFTQVESGADRAQRASKMAIIEQIYKNLSNEMRNACAPHDKRIFDEELYATLSILSQFMENNKNFRLRPYENYELDDVLPLRWTSISSILYALSILTTTGYGHVTPMTTLGQWLSIGYGLFGIPLMILGAVDIGRFLSDVVLFSYAKIEHTSNHLSQLFGFTWKTSTMISQVETKAIKILQNGSHLRNSFSSRHKSCGDYALMRNLTDGSSPTKPNGVHTSRKRKRVKYQDASPSKKTQIKKHLPLSVNAAILLIFCMLGGLVYMAAGGKKDTFIEGFFVTFNLVANLTMSELPTDVSRLMTVVYIFVFVTFGLAVLSMCADLAASELKWVFLKIHYFGRKINWKRKSSKKEEQMQTEVTELLKIINQIRAKYPDKQQITSVDILRYVRELDDRKFDGSNPYRIFNMFLLQRRDTIAFMPRSIEGLKFADELEDLDETTAVWMMPEADYERQLALLTAAAAAGDALCGVGTSRNSGASCGDASPIASSAVYDTNDMPAGSAIPSSETRTSFGYGSEINWRRVVRPRSDPNTFIPFLPYLFHVNRNQLHH